MENHLGKHGHAREPIWTDWQGRKVVVVGNQLALSSPQQPWKTFHDFLLDNVRSLFGQEWADAEIAKSPEERHPVFKMNEGALAHRAKHATGPNADGVYGTVWNGDVGAFLTLAYDLFTVADNAQLQDRIVRRLRHPDQYQGARYELFAIASCVRAGFSIEYEDESDVTKKHPELIATHRASGLKVAVEAKSRHRPGVLGFKNTALGKSAAIEEHRARIRGLLLDALKKDPGKPFVVFLDVNLPGVESADERPPWVREVAEETLPSLSGEQKGKLNLLLCTSIPFHYGRPDGPIPLTVITAHEPDRSTYPIRQEVLEALVSATQLFKNVPHAFPGKNLAAETSGWCPSR
jgi:hypothetical protein